MKINQLSSSCLNITVRFGKIPYKTVIIYEIINRYKIMLNNLITCRNQNEGDHSIPGHLCDSFSAAILSSPYDDGLPVDAVAIICPTTHVLQQLHGKHWHQLTLIFDHHVTFVPLLMIQDHYPYEGEVDNIQARVKGYEPLRQDAFTGQEEIGQNRFLLNSGSSSIGNPLLKTVTLTITSTCTALSITTCVAMTNLSPNPVACAGRRRRFAEYNDEQGDDIAAQYPIVPSEVRMWVRVNLSFKPHSRVNFARSIKSRIEFPVWCQRLSPAQAWPVILVICHLEYLHRWTTTVIRMVWPPSARKTVANASSNKFGMDLPLE